MSSRGANRGPKGVRRRTRREPGREETAKDEALGYELMRIMPTPRAESASASRPRYRLIRNVRSVVVFALVAGSVSVMLSR